MPVSQRDIFNLSYPFIELANEIDVAVLEELRKVTNRLIDEPNQNFERRIQQFADMKADEFVSGGQQLTEENLSEAYLLGLIAFDNEINQLSKTPRMQGNPLPDPTFPERIMMIGMASRLAREKLKDYPRHVMMYGQYEASLKERIARFKNPYVRSSIQNYREMVRETLQPEFRNGNKLTRIDMSQRILNDFANKGINTVSFPSGHRMSVEAFAEREARSYINNVSLQANTNRAVERGYDLVRITQYAGASPMCEPHQGNVYSLSGDSEQYPPFSEATFDGTYNYGSGIGHDYSYSMDTYVFTNEGWKLIRDCKGHEKIMSLNPETHEREWANIVRQTSYNSDSMVQFSGLQEEINLLVTPDHDMYVELSDNVFARVRADKLLGMESTHLTGISEPNCVTLKCKEFNFEQMVCCLTLDRNHLMLVKRSRIPVWSTNCGHTTNTYIPGVSESLGPLSRDPVEQRILNEKGEARGNRFIFNAEQNQRKIERQIRMYKRRKAVALTEGEKQKAQKLVRNWQARQREWIKEHPFLRRQYKREAI